MGGNVTAIIKSTGFSTRAEKVNLKEIGITEFRKVVLELFESLNEKFYSAYGTYIWNNEEILTSGYAFNGSTSYIMNPVYTESKILQHKNNCGDIDITVPHELKEQLWELLDSLENEFITVNCQYMGSNKLTVSSIGEQINSVFKMKFKTVNEVNAVNVQIDFEFLEYKNHKPTEWAKFSHSSSFEDCLLNIKSVNHKYLIRALVGAASVRNDIIIATPKSSPEKIILSKSKIHNTPRMLKFSVSRGIRVAYEPLISGGTIYHDGKMVYKEIPSKTSSYITEIQEMIKLIFGVVEVSEKDLSNFQSFGGVINLMKQYLTDSQIYETHQRYLELLWAPDGRLRAQELEANNPGLDYDIKHTGYLYFIKELNLMNDAAQMITTYYKSYGTRK